MKQILFMLKPKNQGVNKITVYFMPEDKNACKKDKEGNFIPIKFQAIQGTRYSCTEKEYAEINKMNCFMVIGDNKEQIDYKDAYTNNYKAVKKQPVNIPADQVVHSETLEVLKALASLSTTERQTLLQGVKNIKQNVKKSDKIVNTQNNTNNIASPDDMYIEQNNNTQEDLTESNEDNDITEKNTQASFKKSGRPSKNKTESNEI